MKKLFVLLPVVAAIAACSNIPKDDFEKRSAALETKRESNVEKSISKAPGWMGELPTSKVAVYANGTAVSSDMNMADYKAKLFAYGKICMAAGGKVSQQAKTFMQDTTDATNEMSELAIKSMCPGVDITGVETKEVKRVAEGSRFRSYALVVLPVGEANLLQSRKDQLRVKEQSVVRGTEAFKELDAQ